ncbi:bifunctional aldolase/short-chain dehydrogenase [Aquibium sp. A9E412]|uniref:bifunctional aldolase/short-chain dehydrogenase n=1 Tax=Aquibium sp. A9E412 TaxID=2976767 RepID=UPI0025AF2E22|nr:bifunctional aldolase/short-chain dehydrogenase [Aquibium sp. A9E412]MDN2566671.1 bifunctional aldolase/short-chain dehydrogenase [Aquibium sp. A9E412]
MKSLWNDADARRIVEDYAARGVEEGMALRVYTTRLLGGVPSLVLHGGGNTSYKTERSDLIGERHEVLCVKGSGWDMAVIEPAGLPAVKLEPLRRARRLARLADEDMVALQRLNLLDPKAPNPSVETLLHAYLPHRFVDHTHSTAILALVDQEDSRAICQEVFGARMGFVPYIMPGFQLAKAAAEVYEADPSVEGLILDKHGIFTFGDSAREAYERMIAHVTRAEAHVADNGRSVFPAAALPAETAAPQALAPILRGAVAEARGDGRFTRFVADFRTGEAVRNFVDGAELADYGTRGVSTPDLTIRIKNKPLILPAPTPDGLDAWAEEARRRVAAYADDYRAYFERCDALDDVARTMLDPMPRLALVPGVGLFGFGKTAKDAAISADVGEIWIEAVTGAERLGRFTPLPEDELFRLEYWSLEQAKLAGARTLPLTGQVAVVTGGGGAIGAATARLFAANGAHVVVADLDRTRAEATAAQAGNGAVGIACDVTAGAEVAALFEAAVARFGGVDIVVSNAGAAIEGEIGTLDDAVLRQSFELNFFAHQAVAREAVRLMKLQRTGGVLLFNASKQAVNPGANFGAYGLPKAATLFLSRQYALEYGAIGIRANAVNADRIRSGLLTDAMIASRAQARNVSEKAYLSGNLLGLEVTADDVARAFLHQALAERTTADVTTVDGGNIAAALR